MFSSYLSDQSFLQLLSDAIYFLRSSEIEEDKYHIQRFSRASILNSCLSIEAAANCCIYHLNCSKNYREEIEKLTSFAKLDLYVQTQKGKIIDRGNIRFQKIKELKKIRDSFVHPKKIKIPASFSLDEEKHERHVELKITFDSSPLSATKIDKSSLFWFSSDAKIALKCVLDFFDYYFLELLELESEEVLGLVGNNLFFKEDYHWLFHPQALDADLAYLAENGINQSFIKLEVMEKLVAYPPV